MITETGLDDLADGIGLESESGLLEGRDHLALSEETEIAALLLGGAGGIGGGQSGEIGPGENLLAEALELRLGGGLLLRRRLLVDLDQDMAGTDTRLLGETIGVLRVEIGDILLLDDDVLRELLQHLVDRKGVEHLLADGLLGHAGHREGVRKGHAGGQLLDHLRDHLIDVLVGRGEIPRLRLGLHQVLHDELLGHLGNRLGGELVAEDIDLLGGGPVRGEHLLDVPESLAVGELLPVDLDDDRLVLEIREGGGRDERIERDLFRCLDVGLRVRLGGDFSDLGLDGSGFFLGRRGGGLSATGGENRKSGDHGGDTAILANIHL